MPVAVSEPLITKREPKDRLHAIVMIKPEDDRSNHVIEAGAEASAGDNAALELEWVKVDIFKRPCQFKMRWFFALLQKCLYLRQGGVIENMILVTDKVHRVHG